MFNKLKDKLSSFKQSIGKTIDEKAVDLEEPVVESIEEPTVELIEETPVEPIQAEEKISTPEASTTPVSQPLEKPSFKQKIGFAQKAKALVFEREVILDEDDISDSL
ncbi:MAG: hypothetical protein GKC08_02140, partial [Methanosarcinales archaeon]|nr:hypothetical protein [Methanosarcinales archaeon]